MFASLALGLEADAQDKQNKEKGVAPAAVAPAPEKEKGGKLHNVTRIGYTRPGAPEDKLNQDGSVRAAAWDPLVKGKLIGGTVYYLVLQRTGDEGDTWGTGIYNFNERFVEGKNFKNKFSPALDAQAKYLYLYQIVNDRGLDPVPGGVKFAAGEDLNVVPIAGSALRIVVDPRYITSWGHFKGTGFNARVPDRNRKGDIRLAADKTPAEIRLAVSSNPSILEELPNKRYRSPAPAQSLKNLADSFGLGLGTLNLKMSAAFDELAKKKTAKVALAAYEQNILQAAEHAREPEYVQLLYSGFGDAPALNNEEPVAAFRADWRGKEIMDLGFHSVVFGFTSDVPPGKNESIRIEDKSSALKGAGLIDNAGNQNPQADDGFVVAQEGEQFVQQGKGAAPGNVFALGTAPSPGGVAGPAGGAPAAFGGMGGGAAGFPMGGGFGGGFSGGFGGGGFGSGTGSGGGFGGGGGFGSGNGNGNGNANQKQAQQGNININISLKNQQQQQQRQQQQQQQQNSNTPPGVVPTPRTIILGLLGLPGLYFLRRRLMTTAVKPTPPRTSA